MMKKVQVIALPTEKASRLYQIADTWYVSVANTVHEDNIGRYLYFTTDEEIKPGNWFIYGGSPFQYNNKMRKAEKNHPEISSPRLEGKKVVATNNPDLWLTRDEETGMTERYGIPKIALDFVEAFVEVGGSIKEVNLEYWDYSNKKDQPDWAPKLRGNGTVIIWPLESPTTKEIKKGDVITIQVQATVLDVSDAHGLCYKLQLPKKDFIDQREFWVDETELKTR